MERHRNQLLVRQQTKNTECSPGISVMNCNFREKSPLTALRLAPQHGSLKQNLWEKKFWIRIWFTLNYCLPPTITIITSNNQSFSCDHHHHLHRHHRHLCQPALLLPFLSARRILSGPSRVQNTLGAGSPRASQLNLRQGQVHLEFKILSSPSASSAHICTSSSRSRI